MGERQASFVAICHHCDENSQWSDRNEFLADPQINLTGYRPDFDHPIDGRLLFTHRRCEKDIALPMMLFLDLYQGVRYDLLRYGTPECNRHCLSEDDLSRCSNQCSMASLREVLAIITEWKKCCVT